MRRLNILLLSVMLLIAAISPMVAQEGSILPTAPLKPFETLYIDALMDVKLVKVDDSQPLRMTYELGDNDIDKFKFVTKQEGVLSVTLPPNPTSMKRAKATIYYHSIRNLDVRGASVEMVQLKSKMLDIKVNYKGVLTGDIISEDIVMSVQSDSRVEITGECKYLTLEAASRSKVELRPMSITSANLSAVSGGVIAVNAGDRMEVKVGANSVIKYWGEPNILRQNRAFMGGSLVKQD